MRYHTYEKELLAGTLTIATQYRILSHLPLVWLCDNQATVTFLDGAPPTNPRLRRWYTFLSQFQIAFRHIAGVKNELCDWLSRTEFQNLVGINFDEVASEAFERMDRQLDFAIHFRLSDQANVDRFDYVGTEYEELWSTLEEWKSTLVNDKLMFKSDGGLFCETKRVVPESKLERVIKWCHEVNGHPGPERTILFFLQRFFSARSKASLIQEAKPLCDKCEVCLKSKPNTAPDRGLVNALLIPQLPNDLLFIDFIALDPQDQFNYVLTIVDSLSRFSLFIPCSKNISGEETLKLILKEWISHYGKPSTIMSDNDVRFSREQSFYQNVFRSLGIEIKFSVPRHPQSSGLCERTNRAFLQNLRAMTMEMRSMDWPKLTPIVTWLMNSQVSPKTGYSPMELFFGRPSWKMEISPEPDLTPSMQIFLQKYMDMQEKAVLRLKSLRGSVHQRRNRGRVQP